MSGVVCEVPCWRVSLDDAPQSGGPVEADSDHVVETLIENNQNYTTWEIVNILKISKSRKLLVKTKNVSLILRKKKPYGLFGQPDTCN